MNRLAPLSFALTLVAAHQVAAADESIPWQLRPAAVSDSVRADTAVAAFNDEHGNLDLASTNVLAASYRLTDEWAPFVRVGFVGNNAPGAVYDGTMLASPVVGATYARRAGVYRFALTAATSLPVGTGNAKTHTESMTARPADRAMFDADYLTEIAGVDVAYVNHGLTAQAEATLMPSVRVRGDRGDRVALVASVGLHLGYAFGSHVSLGTDVRYQDAPSVSLGGRLHFHVGQRTAVHPGLSLTRGLESQLISAQPMTLQLDVPVMF